VGTNIWRGPTRRRRALVVAGVVLLAAIVAGTALVRTNGDEVRAVAGTPSMSPTATLTVGWGGFEGNPSCAYDPQARTVDADVTIDGHAPRRDTVTVTVTAYADENTSRPFGSGSRSVQVEGSVHIPVHVAFPVEQAPLVDIDGETACGVEVDG
jgi:hypothetical protein